MKLSISKDEKELLLKVSDVLEINCWDLFSGESIYIELNQEEAKRLKEFIELYYE